ncbi:MAG: hypothetical protein PCFJNLEI_00528 [Verrucomicrobiae bacterium]|nr:hypothetical protein [Verrucomicrobiae bacterium]
MPSNPTPSGLAIVVCDQIIEDKATSKKSLIGIFNNIASPTFPCRHPQLSVFVSLTEGRGTYQARARIVNEETQESVTEVNGQIQLPDVNMVAELVFNFIGLEFPAPGLYSIEFYCDDALILERRFHVMQAKPPPKGPPPEEM